VARLFVAIELPDAVRQAIAAEQQRIVGAGVAGAPGINIARSGGVRCVRPDHLHVTLAFIGDVDEARAAAIVEASSAPLAAAPFDVAFGAAGVFPPRGAPRVLWLGLTSGAAEVGRVQRLVAARLAAIGIALEKRPFHPHVTLARWRRGGRTGRGRRPSRGNPGTAENPESPDGVSRTSHARRAIDGRREAPVARLAVDAVTLFQSRLSPAGSAYAPLARARLVAAPASPLQ
jgi:2'-5' RNA ligase